MGWIENIGQKIRGFWASDKEELALRLSKGSTASGYQTGGPDLLQAYGYDVVSDYLRLEHDLLSRYVDYEEMDDYPEIAAAIDIFSDDSTVPDTQINRTIWVTSPDQQIQKILDDLFHKTLRMDEEIWEIARTLVKYGNDYEEILVTNEGVKGLNFLPPPTVRRIEGPRGELYGFIQDFKGRFTYSPQEFQQILASRASLINTQAPSMSGVSGQEKVTALEDWEVTHFRLRGKHRRSLYGFSVVESARWIWKRLMLLEDAALIFRLQRAPERYAFYVDTGDLPPAESLAYVNRVRQQFKKKKFFNPTTGRLDLKFDPLSQDDDFFIPVRKGTESNRVEVLGSPSWQHMDDIEYFRDKMFAAIKIPKAYLGQEDGVARAVLSSEDVRFARTVLRVQRELRNGLSKVARVHLAALNIDPKSVDYDIHMTVPSAIFELAQLEVRNARADLAGRMKEYVSLHWILSQIFGMSEEEIQTIVRERDQDVMRDSTSRAKADAASNAIVSPELGVPAPGPQQAVEPGLGVPEAKSVRALLSRGKQPLLSARGIPERELFEGSREGEKRAEEKLNKLLKTDKALGKRLDDLRDMLKDLHMATGGRAAGGTGGKR